MILFYRNYKKKSNMAAIYDYTKKYDTVNIFGYLNADLKYILYNQSTRDLLLRQLLNISKKIIWLSVYAFKKTTMSKSVMAHQKCIKHKN